MESVPNKGWKITMGLNGDPHTVKHETGTQADTLPEKVYQEIRIKFQIQKTKQTNKSQITNQVWYWRLCL